MPPKVGNAPNAWNLCENCSATVLSKNIKSHNADCPPNLSAPTYNFVLEEVLFGTSDVKTNEEIKALTPHDKDNLVFLSQSAIHLCKLAIGDSVRVTFLNGNLPSFVRVVWPTTEKTLSSVMFTKNCMEMLNIKPNCFVRVEKIAGEPEEAGKITVTMSNAPAQLELSSELQNRLHRLHLERSVTEGNVLSLPFYGKVLKFEIKSIDRSPSVEEKFAGMRIAETGAAFSKISEKTSFALYRSESEYVEIVKKATDPFAGIGGLDGEIRELGDLIDCGLGKREALPGFKSTRGILLYGNSGTGKTLLADALSAKSGASVVRINAADLYGKYAGNPEDNIKMLFDTAVEQSPSVVLLDDVDILCPSRGSRLTDTEKRIVSCTLNKIDEISGRKDGRIVILACSNKVENIDAAFRRCGRFEREIEIQVPNPNARLDILRKLLNEAADKPDENVLREIANDTHGFVGADLLSLCSRAALHAGQNGRSSLSRDDFKFALTRVRPSAMREVQIEVPNVKWTDIGGQKKLKLILKQCVEWPLKHADCFLRMGISPPRGVLMFGPPGCSKTMIAKALATESGLNFLSIKGPELFSKWVGESERAVREVFRKARQVAPSIVFFDEIDALGGERGSGSGGSSSVQERVLAQLLTELDGVTPLGDVTILAATNRPDRIDKALLRPGRLDRIVHVPLPDEETRKDIFRIKLSKMPISNVEINDLVSMSDKYSGAEVNAVCHEAAMMALEEDIEATVVEMRHFERALELITPRTPDSLLKIYEDYNSK